MRMRLANSTFRICLAAVLVLTGWVAHGLQTGGRYSTAVKPKAPSSRPEVEMSVAPVETRPQDAVGDEGWQLPGDECDYRARHIVVFDRLYYKEWTDDDCIVDVAIVNMSTERVAVERFEADLCKSFYNPEETAENGAWPAPTDMPTTRVVVPHPRGPHRSTSLSCNLSGWIKGSEVIPPGGVSIARFRLPKKRHWRGGPADELDVWVKFDAITAGVALTRHNVWFPHLIRGERAYGETVRGIQGQMRSPE